MSRWQPGIHTPSSSHTHTQSLVHLSCKCLTEQPHLLLKGFKFWSCVYWSHMKYMKCYILSLIWHAADHESYGTRQSNPFSSTQNYCVELKRSSARHWCRFLCFDWNPVLAFSIMYAADTLRLARKICLAHSCLIKRWEMLWGAPTHAHNHLAMVERIPEVSYFTSLFPPGAKLKMTPSDYMCVNTNKAKS